jgi:hypothetical protein
MDLVSRKFQSEHKMEDLQMKRYLVLISCLLLFGGLSAFAADVAPTYQVTTTPTKVIFDGRSESIGAVRITAMTAVASTYQSTIEYNFQNLACDLSSALPIPATAAVDPSAAGTTPQLIYSGTGTAVAAATITAITNLSSGCTVSVTVPEGDTTVVGDYLELDGVRGRVDISPAGDLQGVNLNASLSSTPSTSSLFTVPNGGVVAISQMPWEITKVVAGSALFCLSVVEDPTIYFKEDFNGAFVQYVDASGSGGFGLPSDNRPIFGAKNNTELHIVVTGLPTGTKLAWPTLSSTMTLTGGGVSEFSKVSQSSTGDDAVYEYSTETQGDSDITLEAFTITPHISTVGTVAGTATVQMQLYPPLDSADTNDPTQVPYAPGDVASPRFNDPMQRTPADTLLTVSPCHSNLLFPWMAFIPAAGYDTGVAIANTTSDPYGTTAQNGQGCTLNFFPTSEAELGDATTPPVAMTAVAIPTPVIMAGSTFAVSMSNLPQFGGTTPPTDFVGYMIAVCNFQFGHAFAFITDNLTQPTGVAEGYVALLIPDPAVIGHRFAGLDNTGEGLKQ